ncbi:hypothetical protein T484DRAFT_1833975 [Baffinella frigidus]|nr:hypothetical protein T484DRAFT_1833975 [Cryptophyta sp. CCMP2293]
MTGERPGAGPHHFLDGGSAPNGSTILKRRQLVHMGYKLVSIPYWEWIEIRAVPETLREYLRRKLGA